MKYQFEVDFHIMGDPDTKRAKVAVSEEGKTFTIHMPDGHAITLTHKSPNEWVQAGGTPFDGNTQHSLVKALEDHLRDTGQWPV